MKNCSELFRVKTTNNIIQKFMKQLYYHHNEKKYCTPSGWKENNPNFTKTACLQKMDYHAKERQKIKFLKNPPNLMFCQEQIMVNKSSIRFSTLLTHGQKPSSKEKIVSLANQLGAKENVGTLL